MSRLSRWSMNWACACLLGLACAGCQQDQSTADSASRPPEVASFDEIVQIVTRALDTGAGTIPGGFVSSDTGGRSAFTVNNRVTSSLVPPAEPDENYRGSITVTSITVYSIRRSNESDDDQQGDKNTKDDSDGFSLLDDPDASDQDFASADQQLVTASPPDGTSASSDADSVDSRKDEDVRTFELEYRNGRWTLLTQPDPETERSVQRAFDYALGLQR